MNTEELLEHADYLLRVAVNKCDSWEEAQDLVQNTLLEGLLALRKGIVIDNAKSWLSTVLSRKYYDLLREKYRKPLTFYGMDYDMSDEECDSFQPQEDTALEEAENLRRLVARQTHAYREVLVRHYFHGQSIETIAKALSLPENTVKSRLRLGRVAVVRVAAGCLGFLDQIQIFSLDAHIGRLGEDARTLLAL